MIIWFKAAGGQFAGPFGRQGIFRLPERRRHVDPAAHAANQGNGQVILGRREPQASHPHTCRPYAENRNQPSIDIQVDHAFNFEEDPGLNEIEERVRQARRLMLYVLAL